MRRASGTLMKRKTSEKVFGALLLALSTGGYLPLFLGSQQDVAVPVDGNPKIQMMWMLVYLITGVLVLLRWKQALYLLKLDWALGFLVILAGLSTLWSAAPDITIRRSFALFGTTLVGLYLAQRFTIKEVVVLLAWSLGVFGVLSIFVSLAMPEYGIMTSGRHLGAWRGVFLHKNTLGRYMSLAVIVFFLLTRRRMRLLGVVGVILSLILVLLSTSKAALIVTVLSLMLMVFFSGFRFDQRLVMVLVLVAAVMVSVVGAWLGQNYVEVLASLGRDPTLTGRTVLWKLTVDYIFQSPWIGHGYDAFWSSRSLDATFIWGQVGWYAPHAHNGFLDLMINVGVVGTILFGISFMWTFRRGLRWIRSHRSGIGLWPVVYLTFLVVYNFGESVVLQRNNLFWVLYVFIALRLAMWVKDEREEGNDTCQSTSNPGTPLVSPLGSVL